jgi:hypothetical protein
MRRTTPLLATCLVALVAGVAWLALRGRTDGPAVPDEAAPEAVATEGEDAALAARGPVEAAVTATLDGRIRVSVLDAQRKPAGGVRVAARRLGAAYDRNDPSTWAGGGDEGARARVAAIDAPPSDAAPDATATTDDAGACEVAVGRPGRYAVQAEPAAPRWGSSATVSVSADTLRPLAALRVGEGTPLRGRVVDARDRPVAAHLRGLWPLPDADEGWSSPRIATEPATGAFAWDAVPEGEGSLHVTIPGRLSITVRVLTPRAGTS